MFAMFVLYRMLCFAGTLDPAKVKGKILACLRGKTARVDKGLQASLAGAVGMILCNGEADGNAIMADPHVLPASQISYKDGLAVFAYINSTKYISLSLSLIIIFFNILICESLTETLWDL